MNLLTEPYLAQLARWPQTGKQILGQFDARSLVVYQAYRPEVGHFAAAHGYFGGEFSFNRMSWIKPNFLWMMYRSGWGTKEGQEVVLAIRLKRAGFSQILEQAVHSSYVSDIYRTEEEWQRAVQRSEVRVQWDPDHEPSGKPVERRALQLGLRGAALQAYAREWIVEIEDISDFVQQQRQVALAGNYSHLVLPQEQVFPVEDEQVASRLGVSIK